jgi:CRISPR-associated protein Csd2
MTIENRYDFVYLFDVKNGNPNGDPDAGNMPRLDPESGCGLVTDVCLKRKIRNYTELTKEGFDGFHIYIKEKAVLNTLNKGAYESLGLTSDSKKLPKEENKQKQLLEWMCQRYFDIRAFGAVMTTGVNCGQVRGPIQFAFATSVEPIMPLEITITRMAVTKEEDIEKERTMGRKHIVPYGLYRAHGFISASLAKRTGFSKEDLDFFWEAMIGMFDHDRSASRGEMAARKLISFKHDSPVGNASAHKLFDLVKIERQGDAKNPARDFKDYNVIIDHAKIPNGVQVQEYII